MPDNDVVAVQHGKRVRLPTKAFGAPNRMAQTFGFLLADVLDVGQLGNGDHFFIQGLCFAGSEEGSRPSSSGCAVKMVLHRAFAAVGDDEDILQCRIATASSTMYWIAGLSTMGSISLGMDLVAGKHTGAQALPRG